MTELSDVPPTYVQIAARSIFDGKSLTLLDLAPATVFAILGTPLSVGHLPTGVFLDHWYNDEAGPGTRPIKGILSLLDPGRSYESNAELLVSLPRIRGTGLEYRTHVLAGRLAEASGGCVLFLRPPVTPVTPMDAARSPLQGQRPSPTA